MLSVILLPTYYVYPILPSELISEIFGDKSPIIVLYAVLGFISLVLVIIGYFFSAKKIVRKKK